VWSLILTVTTFVGALLITKTGLIVLVYGRLKVCFITMFHRQCQELIITIMHIFLLAKKG